jgi:hypothetical protein
MSVVLQDSFSYLILSIKSGVFMGDTPETIYYFGCRKNAEVFRACILSYEFPEELMPEVLAMLEKCELEGRVFWRVLLEPDSGRFQNMLTKARELGASIPEWDHIGPHYHACWNIPAMREFLGTSVTYANRV